ncbi:3-oxoacyl-ACP reductase FabG [Cytobacillus purgationiresistens]|uniref:3-oxoacyl-[acyl-carrier protein] reductase n=1 Tax=Cytobacillus purgationiresistens TaxID=863449 RepID=A0ABU0AEJ4_9BACI|nr:3-oxoacyl-ACP reductase FabG [Cytobacillus purgationiresistens]MDQ0269680.1 3-oxoacyl-[acyl-carrier protein] reductase [Cytobacillus purgationiresistens]
MNLEGKIAVVTGAGQGIGREIALLFAQHGADVVVGDLNVEAAVTVVKEVEKLGRKGLAQKVDVANKVSANQLVQSAIDTFGDLDILVNNAGITRDAMLHKMTEEQFDQVLAVHMKGTFLCMQAAGAYMRKQEKGKIVNISSIAGKVGNMGQVNYAGAKAGIVGMTKAAAKELAKFQVNVNAVQPGFIDTDMTRAVPEKVREIKIAEIPMQRVGEPLDIAKAVIFLSSDYADYMTGNVLEVTGGRFM